MISTSLKKGLHTRKPMPRDFFIMEVLIPSGFKEFRDFKKRLYSDEYGSVAVREVPDYEFPWASYHKYPVRVVVGFKEEVDTLKFLMSYDGAKAVSIFKEGKDTYTVVIKE